MHGKLAQKCISLKHPIVSPGLQLQGSSRESGRGCLWGDPEGQGEVVGTGAITPSRLCSQNLTVAGGHSWGRPEGQGTLPPSVVQRQTLRPGEVAEKGLIQDPGLSHLYLLLVCAGEKGLQGRNPRSPRSTKPAALGMKERERNWVVLLVSCPLGASVPRRMAKGTHRARLFPILVHLKAACAGRWEIQTVAPVGSPPAKPSQEQAGDLASSEPNTRLEKVWDPALISHSRHILQESVLCGPREHPGPQR